ncbi:hypothetical protein I549_5154 [Mycobacterium avium subsp. avium 2285 (R)]|nr:hypothetical protein I549_5154 [Mycobacterium avium subsp. avium 2285 (R)]
MRFVLCGYLTHDGGGVAIDIVEFEGFRCDHRAQGVPLASGSVNARLH